MSASSPLHAPPRHRWPAVLAALAALVGVLLLAAALAGARDDDADARSPGAAAQVAPPPTPATAAATPKPAARGERAAIKAPRPKPVKHADDERRFAANEHGHVPAEWVAQFYKIYEIAQRTFGVNWLLIASIHKQETAFSTHPTTYRGLNFAGCCAGPMQFNVTNGTRTRPSTWERYRDSYRAAAGRRPESYAHRTERHPSVYDDFDAIMAAAALLRDSGAGMRLDATAWRAAYDYYGHDLTGVDYASEVVARAIGWAQRSFCINCATDERLRAAVDAAWGAPVRAEVLRAERARREAERRRRDAERRRRESQRHRGEEPRGKREMDGGRQASESNRPAGSTSS